MSVSQLITKIRSISSQHPSLPFCAEDIINALQELEGMVEIDAIKEMIIEELSKILYCLMSDSIKLEPQMFHTVIYGPSGCGKSTLARILSKIWKAAKILSSSSSSIVIIPLEKWKDIVAKINTLYTSHSKNRTHVNDETWKTLREELSKLIPENKVLENDIVIAGRESFVAEYSGQTSVKTLSFLKENMGKCIIVEEAYSLITGPGDNYGNEALTLINRWMEEQSSSNIFIFVGYKDVMKQTIFSSQKGLNRRFLWVFDIQGYTPSGLALIFSKQCQNKSLPVSKEINLEDFFTANYDKFPHFGGDTLKLANMCQTIFYANAFDVFCEKNLFTHNEITPVILEKAFSNYLSNQVE